MESGYFPATVDYDATESSSSRGPLEEQSDHSLATKSQESSYAFFTRRDSSVDPREEDEESEGTLREQDLKRTHFQLIQGVQEWQDGCVYRGEFGLNMKLGYGEFSWPTGETYRGQFYQDHCHGEGTYTWPDGSRFTGMFYLSHREGYGTMYMKTRMFQGLYKAGERFGPGIETYPDGNQDVGLWFRQYLIKLGTETPDSFSLANYPEFSAFLTHSRKRINLSDEETVEWGPPEGQDPFFYEYKRFLLNDDLTLPPDMHIYSTDNTHLPMTDSLRRELDAHVFVNDDPPFVDDGDPWFITNETPLLVKIQKHTYKFRNQKAHSSWNMDAVLEGNRGAFGRSGPKEQVSREMILKAAAGDHDWIYAVLEDNLACADVADSKGYTVLAAAAVHCHTDIVNLLLNYGADVNKCSDEGLTPLSMCFLLYYPSESFKPNIAERTVSQEPPKLLTPDVSFLTQETNKETLYEVAVPTPNRQKPILSLSGSQEVGLDPGMQWSRDSMRQRSNSQRWDPPSAKSNSSDLEKKLEDRADNADTSTLCSVETNFESTLCVQNYSIQIPKDIVEKSAPVCCKLHVSSYTDKGIVKTMAQSMVECGSLWQTIKLLLRRGADPNLCHVPMQVLFLAVKAADEDGVKLLLESGAWTDIQYPPQLRSLTPLHIAVSLPGEEGVSITEMLLHTVTNVDARAADQDDVYKLDKLSVLPSSLKLSNEPGPPSTYYTSHTCAPDEGGRTALHVACEREDSKMFARDIVRLLLSHKANPNMLWSGHSPLSLSIASGNDLVVKELLSQGADPNLPLTRGLGTALCVICDVAYEHQRSTDSRLALIDQLISYGADILKPVTLVQGETTAVGTAVDYGYFKFYQDRKIAHCPFHALTPAEREIFLARKRLLEYMGVKLRSAVLNKESQFDMKTLYLSKRVELYNSQKLKKRGSVLPRAPERMPQIPFFKFCYQCGRSIGVRLLPCSRCFGILTCSKYCKTKAWTEFHKKDCSEMAAMWEKYSKQCIMATKKPRKPLRKSETLLDCFIRVHLPLPGSIKPPLPLLATGGED